MAEYLIQSESLDAIADAINAKTGGSSAMTPAEMVTAIGSIQTGGGSKTLTKLFEADVSEAVRAIDVTITDSIRTCEMFCFMNSSVVLSVEDWLAIRINNNLLYGRQKDTTQNDTARTLAIAPSFTINGVFHNAKPLSSAINGESEALVTQDNNWSSLNNGVSSIQIGTYTGNADITAGHFEIWGWV